LFEKINFIPYGEIRISRWEAFIGKAFKGAALPGHRKLLITLPMTVRVAPAGRKLLGGFGRVTGSQNGPRALYRFA
jgi:hypothetical protein